HRAMPSPISSTRPTSAVSIWPRKSSISFWMTEAISSGLNFMEAPLAQAASQLFQASPQRTVINGIVHANDQPADQRRVRLRFKNRFKVQRGPQPLLDRPPRLVRQRLRRLHGNSFAT